MDSSDIIEKAARQLYAELREKMAVVTSDVLPIGEGSRINLMLIIND